MFDTFTLACILAVVHFLVTGLMCLAWKLTPNIPGVNLWAIGRIFTTLALLCVALKETVSFEVSILLGQSLFFIGQYFVWQGSAQFMGLKRVSLFAVSPLFVCCISVVALGLIVDQDPIRLIVSSLIAIGFCCLNAKALWAHYDNKVFFACRIVAIMLWLQALLFSMRLFFALSLTLTPPLISVDQLQQLTFFENIAASILIGVGYIVLITERLLYELKKFTDRDFLTGALVRRAFFQAADHSLYQLQQQDNNGIACLVMDLDHFKTINDGYGHVAGDKVLQHVAHLIEQQLRENDIFARMGGEEFILLLPGVDNIEANAIAETIRSKLENAPCHYGDQALRITVSIGLVSYEVISNLTIERLFQEADNALYEAKELGRNQVIDFHFGSQTSKKPIQYASESTELDKAIDQEFKFKL